MLGISFSLFERELRACEVAGLKIEYYYDAHWLLTAREK
jgi:hypothetical protein